MFSILAAAPTLRVLAQQDSPEFWNPQFLKPEQNDALIAVGERIIPGSAEALCNRLIDSVLAIDSDKNRNDLLAALAGFDQAARERSQKPFRELAPAQQDEILTAVSEPPNPLHAQFLLVKEWMADAYWSSLKGLKELGWTGRVMWDAFPNCGSGQPHN